MGRHALRPGATPQFELHGGPLGCFPACARCAPAAHPARPQQPHVCRMPKLVCTDGNFSAACKPTQPCRGFSDPLCAGQALWELARALRVLGEVLATCALFVLGAQQTQALLTQMSPCSACGHMWLDTGQDSRCGPRAVHDALHVTLCPSLQEGGRHP